MARWPAALLTAIFLLFAGCKDDDEASVDVVLRSDFVDCNATTNRILATGSSMSFVATIVEQDGDETWCAFDSFEPGATPPRLSKEGQVGIPMTIYLLRNEVEQERTATIDVVFADATVRRLTFTQGAYSETAWYDRKWGEQPAYRENESYVYKTYFTDLKRGGHVRNFTVCFDTGKRVAHWAAYPLTLNYVSPAVDRTDKWAYDPNNQQPVIPQSAQANIIGYYGSGYARGHQVPSADRYSTIGTNEMTFYATNIMPQNGNFNSGVWGALESKIREVRSLHNADTIFESRRSVQLLEGAAPRFRRQGRVGVFGRRAPCHRVLVPEQLVQFGFDTRSFDDRGRHREENGLHLLPQHPARGGRRGEGAEPTLGLGHLTTAGRRPATGAAGIGTEDSAPGRQNIENTRRGTVPGLKSVVAAIRTTGKSRRQAGKQETDRNKISKIRQP